MKKTLLTFFLILAFFTSAESKEKIGWLESVRIFPGNIKLRAKIDTGAKGSSINMQNAEQYVVKGEKWISFEVKVRKRIGKAIPYLFTKKILRYVKIKKRGGGFQQRPVVLMDVCIAGVHKQIEMNLYDRSNFNYQVLIGRDDLEGFIIDPSISFSKKPKCKKRIVLD